MSSAGRRRQGWWVALVAAVAAGPAAGGPKTLADDQCVTQCDEQSDRCSQAAGTDTAKQKKCDDTYTECLDKCR